MGIELQCYLELERRYNGILVVLKLGQLIKNNMFVCHMKKASSVKAGCFL